MEKNYILAIDSGSTGIRAILFDTNGRIVNREYKATPSLHPEEGAIEQDPLMMWESLVWVVNQLLSKTKISASQILAAGITNQRSSFCLWEKETGKPLSNIINWADVRAAKTCDSMNKNGKWRFLKGIASLVGKLTGNTLMKIVSMLNFSTDHVSVRLKWLLDKNTDLKNRCKKGEVLYGTLDTWYIYKLTGGKSHVTDYSNASSSGLYNHFNFEWNDQLMNIFDIPTEILPEVIGTNGHFGDIDVSLFGAKIPIHAVAGDQQSALFGHCCFNSGDVKISQGSGAFVDCNIGSTPNLSKRGLIPLLAWKLINEDDPVYLLEGFVATAGTLIDWLGEGIGLSDTPEVLNSLAAECDDSEGVTFIPTPSGIRYPHYNPRTKATILGLSLTTHRRHVARAVLEGIAMRLIDIIEGIETDLKLPIKSIKVDGGVSKSDLLLQILADNSGISIERAPEADMTATGIAFLAGLGIGLWKTKEELRKLQTGYQKYTPSLNVEKAEIMRKKWKKSIKAVLSMD
jgi:glycerol kinase